MKEILSLRADALLAAEDRPRDAPFFIESTFAYKLRRDRHRKLARKREPHDPLKSLLLRREWAEVIRVAELRDREREILACRLAGDSFEAIAIVSGTTRQAVHKVYLRAVAKVRFAYERCPFVGLAAVFLSEIQRGRRTQNSLNTSD